MQNTSLQTAPPRIRSVHVYEPADPLRVVLLTLSPAGEVGQTEEPVLGVQATLAELADGSTRVEHVPLLWDAARGCVGVLGEDGLQLAGAGFRRVVGPRNAPAAWWSRAIKDAAKQIREQTGKAKR